MPGEGNPNHDLQGKFSFGGSAGGPGQRKGLVLPKARAVPASTPITPISQVHTPTAMSSSGVPHEEHLLVYRGMSQDAYRSMRGSGTYTPAARNVHNDVSTDLETAKHYASTRIHDDPGVVVAFRAPKSALKQDDISKEDYKILRPVDVCSHTVVHGTPEP